MSLHFLFKKTHLFSPAQQNCWGANKSLARPGTKQARKHVTYACDFNNIETGVSSGFFPLQGKAPKEIHAILTEILACFLPGRAKDLSAPVHLQRLFFYPSRVIVIGNVYYLLLYNILTHKTLNIRIWPLIFYYLFLYKFLCWHAWRWPKYRPTHARYALM